MVAKVQRTLQDVSQLQEMFPTRSKSTLRSALLAAAGDVERAAMALLDISHEPAPVQPKGRLQSRIGDPSKKRGSGWHALAAEQQQSHPTQAAPHYVAKDHSHRLDSTAQAFPSLQESQPFQGFSYPQSQRESTAWAPHQARREARTHSQPPPGRQRPPTGSRTPPGGASPWSTPPRGRSPPAALQRRPAGSPAIAQGLTNPAATQGDHDRSASVCADAELARRLSQQLNQQHETSQPPGLPSYSLVVGPRDGHAGNCEPAPGQRFVEGAQTQGAKEAARAGSTSQVAYRSQSPGPVNGAAELAREFGRQLAVSAGWSSFPAGEMPLSDGIWGQAGGDGADSDGKLARLSDRYPWADLELLQAVLVAADWDLPAADFLMSENHTPGASPARSPAVTPQRTRTQILSSGHEDYKKAGGSAAAESSDNEATFRQRGRQVASAMEYFDGNFALEAREPRNGKRSLKPSPKPRTLSRGSARRPHKAAADSSEDEAVVARLPEADTAVGLTSDDIYRKHRGRALALDHKWRRKVDKAAGLLRAGDRSGSRVAFQEARSIRDEALGEHSVAAQLIEQETNAGKGLWELDLHGLHRNEAILAVGKRLALVESLARQPGDPPELKVIVGRGSHSEAGEATIARATQNRLTALDYKSEARGGVLLVRPKRRN